MIDYLHATIIIDLIWSVRMLRVWSEEERIGKPTTSARCTPRMVSFDSW